MKTEYSNVNLIGDAVYIPKFPLPLLYSIINETQEVLKKGKSVHSITGPTVIVGDIHGNFHDLIRIMAKNGYPPTTQYLFLGDYVDRGDMSLEVITFLFVLKANFPGHITLLRGNHEFASVNRLYGFYDSIMSSYNNEDLWNIFNIAFEYLPIAAVLNQKVFCVHGGISPRTPSIQSFLNLTLPIKHHSIVTDATWSDPTNSHSLFIDNQRGKGCQFGALAAAQFLAKSKMTMIIRSHECVDAYRWSFNNQLLTVFSSSNYASNNLAGYAFLDEYSQVEAFALEPFIPRSQKEMLFYPAHTDKESSDPHTLVSLKSTNLCKSMSKFPVSGSSSCLRKNSKKIIPLFNGQHLQQK